MSSRTVYKCDVCGQENDRVSNNTKLFNGHKNPELALCLVRDEYRGVVCDSNYIPIDLCDDCRTAVNKTLSERRLSQQDG